MLSCLPVVECFFLLTLSITVYSVLITWVPFDCSLEDKVILTSIKVQIDNFSSDCNAQQKKNRLNTAYHNTLNTHHA